MKKYLIRLTGINLIVIGLGAVLFGTVFKSYYNPIFPFILVFFFLFSLFTHYLHLKYGQNSFQSFSKTHMIVTLMRLFVYSTVVILYLVLNGEGVAGFVIFIGVLYILYAILESTALTRKFPR